MQSDPQVKGGSQIEAQRLVQYANLYQQSCPKAASPATPAALPRTAAATAAIATRQSRYGKTLTSPNALQNLKLKGQLK